MLRIKEIIERYTGQQQTEYIQRKFFLWMKSPISFVDKEKVLFQVWEDISVPANFSAEKSYRQVERKLGLTGQVRKRSFYKQIARIAAVFLIPVLSLFTAWFYVQNQQTPEIAECYVPHGEVREIVLPDNSHVLVNSGSTLFYPENFNGRERRLYLSGEAKFTVSPDRRKPFIVRVNDMDVEALGTVFNISAFSDNPYIIATLVEGKVRVDIRSTAEKFILSPCEQVVYDKETRKSILKEVRLDYILAWEKGQMVFQSVSLYTIVKELERHYGVTVYLNATGLGDEKLTVKFLYDETLEEVLDVLQHIIPGFKFKIEGDKVYIH